MTHRMSLLIVLTLFASSARASAQVVVVDPATTLRNAATAAIKELVLNVQRDQHRQLRRMSRRLSMYTNLDKYALPDPPRWRTHDFENPDVSLSARDYLAALNYGDSNGAAYLAASHSLVTVPAFVDLLDAAARRELTARLATVNIADATAIDATNDAGRLRYNGRRELAAINSLERDVIDPSGSQSATAVLDKISGASLIAARQRQARDQLLTGIVEQLLIDNKRSRDAEATAMNMQLVTLRDARAANDAFVDGTSDALRTWRQP
jgi:hypothetical protein